MQRRYFLAAHGLALAAGLTTGAVAQTAPSIRR